MGFAFLAISADLLYYGGSFAGAVAVVGRDGHAEVVSRLEGELEVA